MRVARYDLPDGSKQFRPVHRVVNGWAIGDPPVPLPLYRLNCLPATGTIYICEGEKATDAACAIDLPSTTSAHGSSAAGKTNWTPLESRDVVIFPDHDKPGEKYARDVARILVGLKNPARVKIIDLPGLPDGGDIVEFLAAGGRYEQIKSIEDATAWLDPSVLLGGPVMTCLADIEPSKVRWLWANRIPSGRITLFVGRPGEGKSIACADFASRVSTGTPWPDGAPCERGSVLLLNAEDDPSDTTRPRLDAHNADVSKIHILSMVRMIGEDGQQIETVFTLADVPALEQALQRIPDCRLIVIDPIGSYLGGSTDAHRDNEVRGVLAPVAALAAKYDCAVLVVAHRRKSSGAIADDLALGSRAFTGIARAVWHLCRKADADEGARDAEQVTGIQSPVRLLLPGKNNLAPEGDGLAFTIGGDPAHLIWSKEPVRMTADDALAVENGMAEKPGPEPECREQAAEWLCELLEAGPMPTKSVIEQAKAAGMSWSTVRRAKEQMRVRSERVPGSAEWQWRLAHVSPNTNNLNNLSNLSNKGFQEENKENNITPAPPQPTCSGSLILSNLPDEDEYAASERAAIQDGEVA
ncbi:MAG TPA: AAA family ATPase [Tepidisphaeraceae bacterium]|jgi:hypothetical protein